MATYLVDRGRDLRRPSGPFVLNRESPQARDLIDLYLGRPHNLTAVRRRAVTRVGTFAVLPRGAADPLNDVLLEYDQGGGNINGATFPVSGVSASDPVTVATWIYIVQSPGAPRGIWEFGSTWSLGLSHTKGTSGTLRAHVVTTSGGAAQFNTGDTTTALSAFRPLHAVVVWNPGAGLTLYINSLAEASNATATTGLRDVDQMRVYGAPSVEITAGLEGSLADFRVYRRALTASEVWALYDPATRWDLYATPGRRVFFDVGGGGAFTIAADAGAFAVSGTAAALTVGREVTADAGSVSWTGSDASLEAGRAVSAESGSITWTGIDAALRQGRRVSAESGAVTWTGTAASLLAARLLDALAGSVKWTGTDATLRGPGATLDAVSGAVTWSGTAAALRVARRIAAEGGSFTWTGVDAALLADLLLDASPGAVAWAGTDAELRPGRTMSADAGSFTWTGTAATLLAGRRISADAGSVTWTGAATLLTWSGELHVKIYVVGEYRPAITVVGEYRPRIAVVGSAGHL